MNAPANPYSAMGGSSFIDPAALMRIRSLELRARTVVEGFWRGLHRSPFHGFSSEFAEYRPYVPGDDPRHLDWKLLAHSDRACTRVFEAETNVHCHVLFDVSASMHYGSASFSKFEYARTLVASLALFLHEQGDAVGLMTFADRVLDYIPAQRHSRTRHEIFAALEKLPASRRTSLDVPIEQLLRTQRRRGIVLLVSDLLEPIESWGPKLTALAACGHDISLLQILDRAELDFPFEQAALFEDVESGDQRHVEPAAMRTRYLERFHTHQERLLDVCSARGILHHLFPTDEFLEKALFDHLTDRARRRRGVQRARQLR